MIDHLVADLPYQADDRVALLFNNLGATTQMELMIVARKAFQLLGASTVSMPGSDIFPGLERGVIDAADYEAAQLLVVANQFERQLGDVDRRSC